MRYACAEIVERTKGNPEQALCVETCGYQLEKAEKEEDSAVDVMWEGDGVNGKPGL